MEKVFVILLIMLSLSIGFPNSNEMKKKEDVEKNTNVIYHISDNNYKQQGVDVYYPSIDGLQNIEIQQDINEQLKCEALVELRRAEERVDDLTLEVNYEISSQQNNCLSIIYKGYVYIQDTPYPRSTFTTINIDMVSGERLVLGDIININTDFIEIVKNTLVDYINKYEDYRVIYEEKLQYSNDDFTYYFVNADSANKSDYYSFINEKNLGLCLSTSHNTGDYFLILMELDRIKDNLTPKGKELFSNNH